MGLYEFRVLSFGLTNAPAIYQGVMNRIFRPYIWKFVLVYLDDILIFSKSVEEHLTHIRQVLDILRAQKFYGRLQKCHFNQTSIKYLGHIISAEGIRVNPEKIQAVKDWSRPKDVRQIRQFLGLSNYFRKFRAILNVWHL